MALLNKTEFAKGQCGMKASNELAVYISRGNVIVGTDGLIDTENPVNILFVQKRAAKKNNGHEEPPVTVESLVAEVASNQVATAAPKVKARAARQNRSDHREISEGVKEKMNLDKRMKEIDIEKKQRESQLLKNKQDRAAGKLIPTALVKGLFQNQFKSIVMGFKQGLDQMIMEIAKKKAMNINERAELKKEMVKILNSCIDETIKISKRDISSLVAEYSQTSEE